MLGIGRGLDHGCLHGRGGGLRILPHVRDLCRFHPFLLPRPMMDLMSPVPFRGSGSRPGVVRQTRGVMLLVTS